MGDRNQQELSRSSSLPILNRDEVVLKKVQEQDGIISLMQTQIEFQSEVISKHDKLFEDLVAKIQDLTSKVKQLEEVNNKRNESAERIAATSALWTTSVAAANISGENQTSIADMAKETAEQALGLGADASSGYVYDEKLGLYFDQNSGFYYDPVKQLFYNGHTKTYYTYDATTNSYQIHSADSVKRKKSSRSKRSAGKKKATINIKSDPGAEKKAAATELPTLDADAMQEPGILSTEDSLPSDSPLSAGKLASDVEEGEITSDSPTSAESSPRSATNESSCDSSGRNGELLHSYPPCIRAVVQSATIGDNLKKGTLFLVPCTGGTIGSSGSHHAVLLPSSSVDETHAKIHYESTEGCDQTGENGQESGKYFITDVGSQEGTYMNKVRLSETGIPSEPIELVHGTTLQIGEVTLLIHIHPGDFTCGHCEPGLLLEKEPMYQYTGKTAENLRRTEIRKIKKKYGLDRKNPKPDANPSDTKYVDRAQTRRLNVGSENPFAKTEVASTETPIKESNVGFKMLQKMGWKGEGLGTTENAGIKEPIKCQSQAGRAGLGLYNSGEVPLPLVESAQSKRKSEKLAKTKERFKEADTSGNSPQKEDDLDY